MGVDGHESTSVPPPALFLSPPLLWGSGRLSHTGGGAERRLLAGTDPSLHFPEGLQVVDRASGNEIVVSPGVGVVSWQRVASTQGSGSQDE